MKNQKTMWATTKAATVGSAADKSVKSFYAATATSAAGVAAIASVPAVFATAEEAVNNLGEGIRGIFDSVYRAVMAVATVIAVAIIALCFVLRMVSKNPRTAEEATSWMKRVAISWVCLMLISIFINFGLGLVESTGANTDNPWEG